MKYQLMGKDKGFNGVFMGITFRFGVGYTDDKKKAIYLRDTFRLDMSEIEDMEVIKNIVETKIWAEFDINTYSKMNVKETIAYIKEIKDIEYLKEVRKYEKELFNKGNGRNKVMWELNLIIND